MAIISVLPGSRRAGSPPAVSTIRRLRQDAIALGARILICAFLSAMVLVFVLRYSFKEGRLSVFPRVDDVSYMDDGLRRLQVLNESGLSAALKDYAQNPPHSPYSSLLATASYAVFGSHDWAPYIATWPLLFALFLFADQILVGVPLWQRATGLLLLASVPFVALGAYEIRPDFAASLLTAVGIFRILTPGPIAATRWRRPFITGVLFGLSMLVKPTFVPATIGFFLASWALRLWADRWGSDEPTTFAQWWRDFLASALPFVLIPLPHFLVAWRGIAHYIYENQFGPRRSVWVLEGAGRAQHLRYFLTGQGGRETLGHHLYLLLAILAAGAIAALLAKNRAKIIRGAIPLGVMLLLTWLIPTLNPHKHPDFALTSQILLVFVAWRLLGRLLTGKRGHYLTLALIAMTLAGIGSFHRPSLVDRSEASRDSRIRALNNVYGTVVDHALKGTGLAAPRRHARVLLTSAGDINIWLFDYMARQRSQPVDFFSPSDTNDPQVYAQAFDQADFIVAADSKCPMYYRRILSAQIQDDLLAKLRGRPGEFTEIGRFKVEGSSGSMYLFERKDPRSSYAFTKSTASN